MGFRIGNGYDAHRLAENRALVLGGVVIPFEKGLLGHSDADALVHAIIDALLGAAHMGDIGQIFPDSDAAYLGVSSLVLLARTGRMLAESGWRIANIDSIIVAERPKLASYVPDMERCISAALGVPPEAGAVSVKATTEEGMGFTGAGLGIAAYACALIENTLSEGNIQ